MTFLSLYSIVKRGGGAPLRTTSLTLTVSGLESVIIDGARNECFAIKDFSLECILYRLEGAIKDILDFEATSELMNYTSK